MARQLCQQLKGFKGCNLIQLDLLIHKGSISGCTSLIPHPDAEICRYVNLQVGSVRFSVAWRDCVCALCPQWCWKGTSILVKTVSTFTTLLVIFLMAKGNLSRPKKNTLTFTEREVPFQHLWGPEVHRVHTLLLCASEDIRSHKNSKCLSGT